MTKRRPHAQARTTVLSEFAVLAESESQSPGCEGYPHDRHKRALQARARRPAISLNLRDTVRGDARSPLIAKDARSRCFVIKLQRRTSRTSR